MYSIGYKIPYNKSIQTSLNKMDTRKGLSIEVSNSQYDFLYEVLMEAYSNDVAEQKDGMFKHSIILLITYAMLK
ncbi:MAG: hypothetical protein CM15mV10_3000 [uncultured marine virus]|nr:MAG: hypothetical protein CM15mV10_3000 [uncultured marine virus]